MARLSDKVPNCRRRGDNIPDVGEYAHYNEEAQSVWYAENRYDMEHADEVVYDDSDNEYDEKNG